MPSQSEDVVTMVMIASVACNICVVVAVVIKRLLKCLTQTGDGNQHLAYSITEIALSCLCVVAGLYAITSPLVWSSPFDASRDNDVTPVNDIRAIMAAAFGRFVFSFVSLFLLPATASVNRPTPAVRLCGLSQWNVFRAVYIAANIVCFASSLVRRTNYVIGAVILILESDQLLETARRSCCRARCTSTDRKSTRTVALFVLGLLAVGFRIVFPVCVVAVAATKVQDMSGLDPVCLGVACFALTFYTLSALFMLRRQLESMFRRHRTAAPHDIDTECKPEVVGPEVVGITRGCWHTDRSVRQCASSRRQLVPLGGVVYRKWMRRQNDGKMASVTSGRHRCNKVVRFGRLVTNGEAIFNVVKAAVVMTTVKKHDATSDKKNGGVIKSITMSI